MSRHSTTSNELAPNQPDELAIDIAHSPPLWFTSYRRQNTPAFAGCYYGTGDNVELEPDGSISFTGRAGDLITSSGYHIGPFEVESALIAHPAVCETAVIGAPDPERTEMVKAFILPEQMHQGSPAASRRTDSARQAATLGARLSARNRIRRCIAETLSGTTQGFMLRKQETENAAHT